MKNTGHSNSTVDKTVIEERSMYIRKVVFVNSIVLKPQISQRKGQNAVRIHEHKFTCWTNSNKVTLPKYKM